MGLSPVWEAHPGVPPPFHFLCTHRPTPPAFRPSAACPLQQRAASALSPLLLLPFLSSRAITWWGVEAGRGRGWVLGEGLRSAGLCMLCGCAKVSLGFLLFFLLPLVPSPLSLSLVIKTEALLADSQLSQQPSCLGISHPALAVNRKPSQEAASKHRQEGSRTNPRGKIPLISLHLLQPESLLWASSLFLP